MQSLFPNNSLCEVEVDDGDTLLLDSVKEIRANPSLGEDRFLAKAGRPLEGQIAREWGADTASSGSDGANSSHTTSGATNITYGSTPLEPPYRSCFFEDVPSPSSGTTKTSLVELPPGLVLQEGMCPPDAHQQLQQRLLRQLQQQQRQQQQQQHQEQQQQQEQQQLLQRQLQQLRSQVGFGGFQEQSPQEQHCFQSCIASDAIEWSSPSTATSQQPQDLPLGLDPSNRLREYQQAKLQYRIQEQRQLQSLWKSNNADQQGRGQTALDGSHLEYGNQESWQQWPQQSEKQYKQAHKDSRKASQDAGNQPDEYMRLSLRALASRARGRGERLASVGAALHAPGRCTPCLFWFRGECGKGYNCTYCHMVHEGQTAKKVRLSKRNREILRQSQEESMGETNEEM